MSNKSLTNYPSNFIDNEIDETLLSTQSYQQRSCWYRFFGEMNQGSQREGLIALTVASIGGGLLSLPSNASSNGVVLEVIIILICGFISYINLYFLINRAFKYDSESYSDLVERLLGKKLRITFEIITVLFCFGVIVSFQIAFASFIWEFLEYVNINHAKYDQAHLYIKIVFFFVNIWFSLMKDLHSLRYFSMVGLGGIILTIIGVMINYFTIANQTVENSEFVAVKIDSNLLESFATTFFCFICHHTVFLVKSQLRNSNLRRMNKICMRSVLIVTFLYTLITIFGYFTCYQFCPVLMIDYYHNALFTILKLLIAVNLFFGVPLNLQPARQILMNIIKRESLTWHIFITVSLQFLSALLSIIYPQVKAAFGLLGGLFGTIIVAGFPAIIYVLSSEKRLDFQNISILIFSLIIQLVGMSGAIVSVLN